MAYTPDRRDIILIKLFPQAGTEIAGEHRAIALSETNFQRGDWLGRLLPH